MLATPPRKRGEWMWLAVIALAGFTLRAWDADRISVEHFDEGVYAADWYCQPPGLPDGKFPRQYLYAPPLLPNVCFWTIFFSGGNPHSVVWINIAAGTLTIPLLWWVGRTWFGRGPGLFAAALCAFSDLHIAFSRTVLTDVLLMLFLTAGVWTGVRALQTGRPLWIVLGGLLAGLAWWTKYNGWLTLAITGAGLGGWLVFDRPRGTPIGPLVFRWLAMAVIAVVVWSPVVAGLQEHGGYAAVSANHARYVVGLAGWRDSFQAQYFKLRHFESWLNATLLVLGLVVARGLAASIPVGGSSPSRSHCVVRGLVEGAVLMAVAITMQSLVAALAALGLAALLWMWRDARTSQARPDGDATGTLLPLWTTLAWFVGLCLSTPMYTPYPRLTLPLTTVTWLLASTVIARRRDGTGELIDLGRARGLVAAGLLVCGILLATNVLGGGGPQLLPEVAWQDRRRLEQLAAPLIDAAERDFELQPTSGRQQLKAALYVFAEPAIFYHLAAQPKRTGFRFFPQPMGDHSLLTGDAPHPELATFLITGPQAAASASDAAAFDAAVQAGTLRLVQTFPYAPSDLVLLDRFGPEGLPGARPQEVRLYRRIDEGR